MSEQWKPDANDDDVQMPLGVGSDTMASEESYAEPKPKMNASTVGLFAAFGAALIALYLLGLQNKPRTANADALAREHETAAAIERMMAFNGPEGQHITDALADTSRLVSIIQKYLTAQQVGTIPDNPFGEVPVAIAGPDHVDPVKPLPPVDDALRPASEEFNKLKLQMIMTGKPSAAMINNKLVSVGFKFKYLTVKDIQADGVVLNFGTYDFLLKLNAPSMDRP